MANLLHKVFGSHNDRVIKKITPLLERINSLEGELERCSDADLRAKTGAYRQRFENGETLDDLLPESFATVREAAKRTLGQRHYDVQMIGGVILHRGDIAEMKTGEGKTLVATLPCYLNAMAGRGVHVVTVNDYLARRDAEWMGEVHRFLGLEVGVIVHDISDTERYNAYRADIAYVTNNELGFDYLRDNMKFTVDQCAQRDLYYAIVDEVDSILVDEARTPLIISGPSEQDTQLYSVINRIIPSLKAGTKGDVKEGIDETGDFWIDEKTESTTLTEEGVQKVEKMLGVGNLYDPEMISVLHGVNQGLSAHTTKKVDVDYVVKVGETGSKEVIIVDEFTGRLMPGRRWSDGLHQAVEAKEGIQVRSENQTLASVTFQNFFRMYEKLSGMTGTADTEAPEFANIYNLDVLVVPTNRPMIRDDQSDVVFKTKREKFNAVIEDVKERHEAGQPVLVGTISIETSEMLGRKLQKQGVPHNVLNAKQHEREAEIVAQAGRKGAVTIATNMAGRGTDIELGDGVAELGGLHVIMAEKNDALRIDRQLYGRCGRQGDPGSYEAFLSLQDKIVRSITADNLCLLLKRTGLDESPALDFLGKGLVRLAQRGLENQHRRVRRCLARMDEQIEDALSFTGVS